MVYWGNRAVDMRIKLESDKAKQLKLLAYGSLKRGYWNHERFCNGAMSIEEATVRGRLYEMPSGIPVLDVPASDIIASGTNDVAHDLQIQCQVSVPSHSLNHNIGWSAIQGELMMFDDPDPRLSAIDSLEGFVPGSPCLYRRVLLPVHKQDGTVIVAWCYVLGLKSVHLRPTNSLNWRNLR